MRAPQLLGLVLLFTLATSLPAYAAPFTFTFTGTVGATVLPGTATGDLVTVQVVADNGSSSSISQSWIGADLQSASLTAGTYSATYIADFFVPVDPIFQTDGAGAVILSNFWGTGPSLVNFDVFGVGGNIKFSPGGFKDSVGHTAAMGPSFLSAENWSVTTTPVPEPATLSLLGLGLAGAAVRRFRKRT